VRLLFIIYTFPGPGCCAFIDCEGLNDRRTTTDWTIQHRDFREDVIRRDGHACVVTQEEEPQCDAVHLIPHRKGDEVRFVLNSYNHLNSTLFSSTLKK
jgi:hypothetical protein